MSLVGELVRSGQHNNLMSILLEEWEKFTVEINLITLDQGDLLDMWETRMKSLQNLLTGQKQSLSRI